MGITIRVGTLMVGLMVGRALKWTGWRNGNEGCSGIGGFSHNCCIFIWIITQVRTCVVYGWP